MKKILIWGGGLQSRIIQSMIHENNIGYIIGIFDNTITRVAYPTNCTLFNSYSLLPDLLSRSTHFVVAIGKEHGYLRSLISLKLTSFGLQPLNIISKYAVIDKTAELGVGLQIMPGCNIHKFTLINNFSILNTSSTVDHECRIGTGVHIMGSAALAGDITVENYVSVGTNATILPSLLIGEHAQIGAGSVVLRNVANQSVMVGVPAVLLRKLTLNFEFNDLIELDKI
jgi:sugar O-acyltransferase (sialic acid O-acetyltransferase NeuD family)